MLDALVTDEIVITASRAPVGQDQTAASATVIDRTRIERLGEPLAQGLLRAVPSTSVSVSGPAGSLAQVRIRGAEANHTLLFIDGIRVNDPASGNQPRFELLNADIASRIEVVRGPQSAIWGSEAIGGVIAVNGLREERPGYGLLGEVGSFGFRRASASAAIGSDSGHLSLAMGWQRASGTDSFDGSGDRDGFSNLSGRARGSIAVTPDVELGAAAVMLTGESEFDGINSVTFLRDDTLDSSRNRLSAGRAWARFGKDGSAWSGELSASILGSSNRNLLDSEEINRTRGRRWILGGQVDRTFAIGRVAQRLIGAVEHEHEGFRARDVIYGGFSNQDRDRARQALTLEWRGDSGPLHGGLAVRHDRFNRFANVTTFRGSLLAELGRGLSLAGSYGEGIAQPTFFDLYGFFPGSFVGNPDLRPERSRGVELAIRYRSGPFRGALGWYRQRLQHEIATIFNPATFLSTAENRDDRSRRSGIEAEFDWAPSETIRLSANYALLNASEPGGTGSLIRELRRPRHSGSMAVDGMTGPLTFGATISYSGSREDMDFDLWPASRVRLGAYWLASARLAYAVDEGVELFARGANLLDQQYQDVVGYRTEGRSVHVGIRLARRR